MDLVVWGNPHGGASLSLVAGFVFMSKQENPLSRKKRLAFHVATGDYFATLATVLDLVRQDIACKYGQQKKNNDVLVQLRDDLLFLQDHYRIIVKKKPQP